MEKADASPGVWRAQVRIPIPIIDWVKKEAERNFRSVNAELVELLRRAMQVQNH